ncbi:hypothetical protein Tco_1199366 [Tanacetum coccineum]
MQTGSITVQLNAGRPNINSVRPNINTGRTNVNYVRPNVNTGRVNVNYVRTNVNTGRSKQPVPTCNSNSFSPVRPQVNIDDDPLVSFVTPTKPSGEAQEEEISPTTLEAAKTLSKVASQRSKSVDKGKRYKRRKEFKGKDFEEVNTGGLGFSTGSGPDVIRAKLEANAELAKSVIAKDMSEEDFAKRMVDLVNQRKKYFAEERAKAKRSKPMTQSQLRIYMSNYLKNQGTWKLSQLKKLKFEEIKEEFDKLVKLKEKEKEPVKKMGKRRKQIARKGLHTAKDEAEKNEASEEDDSSSGTNVPINHVPVAVKSPTYRSLF